MLTLILPLVDLVVLLSRLQSRRAHDASFGSAKSAGDEFIPIIEDLARIAYKVTVRDFLESVAHLVYLKITFLAKSKQ